MVDGTRLQLTRLERGSKLSIKDQLKGVAPNFIHSLDAAALVLCLERCRTAGIEDISAIHDAYGTHAANMEPLSVFLREAFVEVHRVDVLGGFRAACRTMLAGHLMEVEKLLPEEADRKADAALPPPLRHGGLNLEAVLRSDYFFA
jgi:DNA-directed RNA polymerase